MILAPHAVVGIGVLLTQKVKAHYVENPEVIKPRVGQDISGMRGSFRPLPAVLPCPNVAPGRQGRGEEKGEGGRGCKTGLT